jgi:hypothetical protein
MRAPTLHGAVDGILHDWCAQQGKQRWGEKTPQHAFHWREISSGFPRAQFIHLMRDGRDVAASWKQARFGPKHLYVAGQRWREYLEVMAAIRKSLPASRFFELRYEDLMLAPERCIADLCDYLREPYAPEKMLSFYRDRTPYRTDERNLENLTRPLMQDNIEKWRRSMPAEDVLIVEAVAKTELERAGYEVTNADHRVSPLWGRFYRLAHPLRRVLAMARNTQGQLDALRELWALSKNRLVSLRR